MKKNMNFVRVKLIFESREKGNRFFFSRASFLLQFLVAAVFFIASAFADVKTSDEKCVVQNLNKIANENHRTTLIQTFIRKYEDSLGTNRGAHRHFTDLSPFERAAVIAAEFERNLPGAPTEHPGSIRMENTNPEQFIGAMYWDFEEPNRTVVNDVRVGIGDTYDDDGYRGRGLYYYFFARLLMQNPQVTQIKSSLMNTNTEVLFKALQSPAKEKLIELTDRHGFRYVTRAELPEDLRNEMDHALNAVPGMRVRNIFGLRTSSYEFRISKYGVAIKLISEVPPLN